MAAIIAIIILIFVLIVLAASRTMPRVDEEDEDDKENGMYENARWTIVAGTLTRNGDIPQGCTWHPEKPCGTWCPMFHVFGDDDEVRICCVDDVVVCELSPIEGE